ncbi:MAG: alpha-L-fucosidase, partial [Clostridia bacterium]
MYDCDNVVKKSKLAIATFLLVWYSLRSKQFDKRGIMKTITEYLSIVDDVIAKGKFKDDWQSLSKFEMPKWYGDGRFGIFIHWGCYSVPAVENEW